MADDRTSPLTAATRAIPSTLLGGAAARVGDQPHGGSVLDFYAPKGSARPPRIARGEGVRLYDEQGRSWLDMCSGPVVSNLGHSHPRIVQAMVEQARKVTFAYPTVFESEANVALAERVCGLAGPGFERAFFCSGGSEANEAALKLARQVALARGEGSRWKIISRNPGYHGGTLGALGTTGDAGAEAMFGPMLRVSAKIPAPFTYRLPAGVDEAAQIAACAQALEETIVAEGAESVLAFIVEPVGGVATGALASPASYYQALRRTCTRHGVLLIHDEVMSGAGRTGRFLASHHWSGSAPDIVTLAKGLAAGYTPFGAVLVSDALVDTLTRAGGFAHGHTYVANPFSCAVARAVVDTVVDERLIERAAERGRYLRHKLLALQAESPIVGDVRGVGLLQAIELVASRRTRQPLPVAINAPLRLNALAFARGLALYHRRANQGAFGDFQLVTPPLISSEPEIDEMVGLLAASLAALADELAREGHLAD